MDQREVPSATPAAARAWSEKRRRRPPRPRRRPRRPAGSSRASEPLKGRRPTRTAAEAAARVGAAARGAEIAAARYRIFRASKTGRAPRQTKGIYT